MATLNVSMKKTTTLQRSVISGVVSKTALFTCPANAVTTIKLKNLALVGGSNVDYKLHIRRLNPITNSFDGAADFTYKDELLSGPSGTIFDVSGVGYDDIILMPGESLRYSNDNGNTHYFTYATIVEEPTI